MTRLLFALCLVLASMAFINQNLTASVAQSGRTRPPANTKEATRPRSTPDSVPAKPTPTPISASTDEQAGPAKSRPGTMRGPLPAPTASGGKSPQRRGPEEVGEDDVVRIRSNLVPLPTFVTDARGHAVSDLQLKDFELLVDGQARLLAELSRAETPITMVMLFDNSASLRSSQAREFEKQAAIGFFRKVMRPVDRAAIVSIWTVPELAQPMTSDVGALVRTIEGFVTPDGATALFDSIVYSADYLKQHRGRKVLVIVSDGTDTISELDFDTTLATVLAFNCQVYAVRTGHSDHANLRDLAGERRLHEFAAQTGGTVYAPRNGTELREAFAQIAADLAQQYVLSYYPGDDPADGRFRTFTLRVNARPGLQVRTRKGYYAPKS